MESKFLHFAHKQIILFFGELFVAWFMNHYSELIVFMEYKWCECVAFAQSCNIHTNAVEDNDPYFISGLFLLPTRRQNKQYSYRNRLYVSIWENHIRSYSQTAIDFFPAMQKTKQFFLLGQNVSININTSRAYKNSGKSSRNSTISKCYVY